MGNLGITSDLKEKIFYTLWKLVDNKYVFFKEKNIDWEKIKNKYHSKVANIIDYQFLYETINNMLGELNDPHTLIPYTPYKKIGMFPISIDFFNDKYYIISNSDKSNNLDVGMNIISFNDISINEFKKNTLNTLKYHSTNLQKIHFIQSFQTGAFGDSIKISAQNNSKKVTTHIHRKTIDITSIKNNINNNNSFEFLCTKKCISEQIGYIKILSFKMKTVIEKAFSILNEFKNKSFLIIDIRHNQGGSIEIAKAFTAFFINTDKIIGYKTQRLENGRHSEFEPLKEVHIHQNSGIANNFKKIIILCNEYTASSAEFIFLKSLKGIDERIIIIGQKTSGLVHGATIFPIFDGSKIQITTSKYFDINHMLLNEEGISPDIYIENSVEFYTKNYDNQLECAVKLCQ